MPLKKGEAKFNFVDAVIVCLILALLAAGVYKIFFVNKGLTLQNNEIEFKVLVEKVRMPSVEGFKVGQAVRDVQTNIVLGTIVNNEISPYKEAVPTLDGKVVLAEVPEKYNVLVTISSPAIVTDNNITIGNKEIKTGGEISIKTNTVTSRGIIFGVTVKE